MENVEKDTRPSLSWFAVFNNPQDHGYTGDPLEILERLRDEWMADHPEHSGAWVYCISKEGLRHVHMVLCSKKPLRFSAIKKTYAVGAHFEPTRGTKEQVMNYIEKKPPFSEKGEEIIETLIEGEIIGRKPKIDDDVPYRHDIFDAIDEMIERGFTPDEIFSVGSKYLKYEAIVKKAYFNHLRRSVGTLKSDMRVYWHVGHAGTGKSYTYQRLVAEHGEDRVYLCTDFANQGICAFDGYFGQPILFIDDLKPTSFPYQTLLMILDEKVADIHARYQNIKALWTEIHITSVYSPTQIYERMVEMDVRKIDTAVQLYRRITEIVYHFKMGDSFESYTAPFISYVNLDQLRQDAIKAYNVAHADEVKAVSETVGEDLTAVPNDD